MNTVATEPAAEEPGSVACYPRRVHWDSWINAEIYDRFVRDRKVYAWLNRRLIELADVSQAILNPLRRREGLQGGTDQRG